MKDKEEYYYVPRKWCIYEEWLIKREITKLKERALADKWKK